LVPELGSGFHKVLPMPFSELSKTLASQIEGQWKHKELTADWIQSEFGTPPNPKLGHLSLPCFKASKVLGKPSNEVAKGLATALTSDDVTVTATGPYANFRWNPTKLYKRIAGAVFDQKKAYGSDSSGASKTILIEYCSPNIAKKLAFQHIRSTLLGNVIANIYDHLGYKTERLNFVGDWGSQFARLLAAVELWGDPTLLTSGSLAQAMDHLFEIYVRFHQEAEKDPSYLEKASKCLQLLEAGDEKTKALWKQIRDLSLKSAEQTLSRLSVRFDHVEGESAYIESIGQTLEDVKTKAHARVSEGAWIVEVEGIPTPALVQKKDGTTLYLTRDIAAAADRFKRFGFDRMLYVVSEQQRLHFQLLFGVLKKMGSGWADRCEHLSFGTVLFGAEKMSTREGRVIFLDALLDEAKERAMAESLKKNPDLKNKEAIAEMVGTAAIIFGELSANRQRDIEFSWEQMLALDGETGPYVQYALVRCGSLLAKAELKAPVAPLSEAPAGYVFAEEEENLLLAIGRLGSVLHQCVRDSDPVHLTRYLIDVSKSLNRFYYQLPVLQATDPTQVQIRLSLVQATAQVLENGLSLLGIACPKEM
jgi:arginyl-tRNA synthetase